jgi:hypothetical protein
MAAPTVDDVAAWAGISQRSATVDALLGQCLDATVAAVGDRLGPWEVITDWSPTVYQAVVMQSARLYKRRSSPEGVAGFGDLGIVRVTTFDPDIEAMLNPSLGWFFG